LKSCCVLQGHYDDERDKTVFHSTTPDLQDQDRFFLVWDRSCPKTDGVTHHITGVCVHVCTCLCCSDTHSLSHTHLTGLKVKRLQRTHPPH